MSSSFPPGGPQGPEYLEQGSGAPLPPEPKTRTRSRKPAVIAGGAIAALLLVGGGVWAATWYFGSGPQPAEALPASTLGYVSIDLDPSGQQKIEALKMLNKFPAIKDQLNLHADDDIRRKIFEEIQSSGQCKDLDYGKDIAPWLGDRMAVAAVDTGAKQPSPVVVVQVKDAEKADSGLAKLRDCGSSDGTGSADTTGGWSIDGDWAVIAESDSVAKKVADEAASGSLADDSAYQKWTGELGDPGVVTAYAAPAAGDWMANNYDQLQGMFSSSGTCMASSMPSAAPGSAAYSSELSCSDTGKGSGAAAPSDVTSALQDFKGMAATIRFANGAIELEGAGDPGKSPVGQVAAGSRGGDVVTTLPADTGVAIGIGLPHGWFSKIMDQMAAYAGTSGSQLMDQLSRESGLDLPQDAETLAGDSAALAVGGDLDPETLMNSGDASGLPVALKVEGDPKAIQVVLGKLAPMAGPEASVLESDTDGNMIAIGPDADYRSQVLAHGSLGDSAAFTDVVPEADKASVVYYVNFDAFDRVVSKLASDSPEVVDNVKPLGALGISAWVDGGTSHMLMKLTTD